jgi:hypothetical protein
VRHALFVEKISQREAARRFNLNFRTIQKIYNKEVPVEYERAGVETKITLYLPFIEQYLEEDKALPRKQRHTSKRIHEPMALSIVQAKFCSHLVLAFARHAAL